MKQRILTLLLSFAAVFTTASAQDKGVYDQSKMGAKVVEMVTANWGQNKPYNNLCPTVGATQTPTKTGCGPTAFAILCHYYKWPECGSGTVTHNDETLDLSTHYYDYDNMLLSYSGDYSDVQATAVATLMRDLGYAAKVEYGTTSTGFSENIKALKNYFSFNNSIFNPNSAGMDLLYRSEADKEEAGSFKRQLKECLSQGYPILFTSLVLEKGEKNGRHIFIVDGYTENDYFHFNFGWGGSGNGWYDLDKVQPDNESDYSTEQRAYLYVIPNEVTRKTVTATATPSNMGTVSINGGAAGSTATANLIVGATATLTATPATGYAFVSWTKNGEVVGTNNPIQVKVGESGNDYVANFDEASNVVVVKNYVVNPTNGSLNNGTAKSSVWTSTDTQPALTLKATGANDVAVNAISALTSSYKCYATAYDASDKAYTNITYTLSVPEGYVIKDYVMTYVVAASYVNKITLNGTLLSSAGTFELSEAPNAQTAAFTMSVSSAGQQYITVKSIEVTVQSEGAGGGSTPTPVTYTINASAGTGGSVKINGDAVSQKNVDENSTVTVVATPQTGYSFVNWTSGNNVVSTNATYSFTATANTTLVANFAKTAYTVAVEATEGGVAYIGTKGTTSTTVGYNDNVTLTAEANDGYEFVKWTDANGGQISTNATISVEVTTDVTYRAVFQSTEQPGEGATESLGGKFFRLKETETETYMNIYDNDTHVDGAKGGVNVTTLDKNSNGQIFEFIASGNNYKLKSATGYYINRQKWNVDANSTSDGYAFEFISTGTSNEYQIYCDKGYFKIGAVDDNANIGKFVYCNESAKADAAVWVLEEVVYYTVTATAGNGGTANASATTVEHGSKVTLTATPNTGYEFVGWYNGETKVSEVANYEFAVTSNVNYTANFKKITYNISVSVNGTNGSAYIGNATTTQKEVAYGEQVTLTATASNGYHFVSWTKGDAVVEGAGAEYTFVPTEAAAYTANFAINTYEIEVSATEGGTASANAETVEHGSKVTLTATPNEGYEFVGWYNGETKVSEVANYEFAVTSEINYVANFKKKSYTVAVSAGEGGTASANAETVEHGSEVTLTATPNEGYEFAGWYNGDEFVSNEAILTFAVTSNINYTARFNKKVVNPTTFAIHVEVASTDGTKVTNNATGNVQAVIADIGVDWCTDYEFKYGHSVHLIATEDCNKSACLFEGWYIKDTETCISTETSCYVTITENMTVEARFSQGSVITVTSDAKSWGYPNMITYENGDPVVGTATELRAVARDGEKLLLSINPNYGYRVANWTDKDGNEVAGKNANSFVLTVNGDNKYTAHIEKATYTLKVRANVDGYGTVNAESLAGSGTEILVGHNMEAKITATPAPGYHFLYWTKGTDIVSSYKEYTIAAIADVENMVDVEYIANFEKNEVAEAGTYYRFAYEFDVPVETPANSAATRAVGDIEYTLTPKDGGMTSGSKTSEWISSEINSLAIRMVSTTTDGVAIEGIQRYSDAVFKLMTSVTSPITTIKYTLSAPDGYVISNYSFQYNQRSANNITFRYDGNEVNITNITVYDLSVEPNKQTAEFTLTSSTFNQNAYLLVKNFTVTIQKVGGEDIVETEKKKFYVQSKAVSGTNAMVMTEDADAASIFYYADSKLMSYSTGTFVNEEDTTCGLQAVGGNAGNVTISENGDDRTATIAAPSYLHANSANGVYFVDHCSGNATCPEHNFIIEEVKALPVTITEAQYATFYAPVAVKIPEGVHAWYLKSEGIFGDHVSMTEITDQEKGGGDVPAKTAVVIGSETPKTYLFEIVENIDDKIIEGNMLGGTVAAKYITVPESEQAYILSIVDEKVGLYKAKLNNNQAFLSKSHRVYLLLDDDQQSSNGFRLVFGTTAIEEVEAENNAEGIYDLSGRKLEGIYGPGIYIVNGKKVLVK